MRRGESLLPQGATAIVGGYAGWACRWARATVPAPARRRSFSASAGIAFMALVYSLSAGFIEFTYSIAL